MDGKRFLGDGLRRVMEHHYHDVYFTLIGIVAVTNSVGNIFGTFRM